MAKFSKKVMGKEVGDASVYAEPHTMDGKKMKPGTKKVVDPNNLPANKTKISTPARRVSMGDPANEDINPHGVGVMRGYGAATKGRKISGKMG